MALTDNKYRTPDMASEEILPGAMLCDSLTSSSEGGLEGFDFDPV